MGDWVCDKFCLHAFGRAVNKQKNNSIKQIKTDWRREPEMLACAVFFCDDNHPNFFVRRVRMGGCHRPIREFDVDKYFLSIKELSALIGLSRSSIYNRLKPDGKYYDPTFPRSVSLSVAGKGAKRWIRHRVLEWAQQL